MTSAKTKCRYIITIQNFDDEKVVRKVDDLRGVEQDTSFLTGVSYLKIIHYRVL